MNAGLIKLLTAFCAVFALIIVAEWFYAEYAKQQLIASLEAEEDSAYDAGTLPRVVFNQQSEDGFADMTGRPLFIEGRRPVPETDESAIEAASNPEEFDWQLMGVYTREGSVMALFSRAKKIAGQSSHAKIAVGGEVGGWRLVEIQADKAILESGGSRRELILRKPKVTEMPKKPGVPPVPRRKPTNSPPVQNTDEKKT